MPLAWSHCVLGDQGTVLDEADADRAHSTASIGKVFLLCEAAERIVDGRLDPQALIPRDPSLVVADSGLWQSMAQDTLPLADVCLLIAAVSDNWATNVLLEVVSLDSVGERARALGCTASRLHDRVRDARAVGDPPTLSTGTARELAEVARRIHVAASGGNTEGISGPAAELVEGWLSRGVDLSMVAAAFGLDPLAHTTGAVRLWSKTGADACIRADVGVVWTQGSSYAYAAIATWSPGDDVAQVPLARMHEVGRHLAARLW